jgi:hypothetical protein
MDVSGSFDMHSQVPLLDLFERDGVSKVNDSLKVTCPRFSLFFLEYVSVDLLIMCKGGVCGVSGVLT